VVAGQDFRDAAVADPELPRDVARPDPELGQLDDPDPDVVGQGPAVDEDSAELKSGKLFFLRHKCCG